MNEWSEQQIPPLRFGMTNKIAIPNENGANRLHSHPNL
jgi:hypothetical protein